MMDTTVETRQKILGSRSCTLYSQPETAQDEWVLQTLGFKTGGFFIEVGAFDGLHHSNTATLERDFGWGGILVEGDASLAHFARNNRTSKVLNYMVGPDSRKRDFFVAGEWGGLCDFTRPNLLAGHAIHHNPIVSVPTVSLDLVLRPETVPDIIDYLSIDLEGAEYPVLRGYFQSKHARKFRCLTVEVGASRDDLASLIELLMPLGYRLDRVVAWDAFFVHPSLLSYRQSRLRDCLLD